LNSGAKEHEHRLGGLVKIMLSFALLLLKRDRKKFWILEFGFKVRLRRVNLIKND
jgi:hypothetical protein